MAPMAAARQSEEASRFPGETATAVGAVLAVVAGGLAVGTGIAALAGLLAAALFVTIVLKPQFGAYLFLITSPLIVGIGRGDIVPVLRPNEALLLLIVSALVTRAVLGVLAGNRSRLVPNPVDLAVVLLAVASSVLPLMARYGRGLPVSSDDILYAMVLWKYLALYLVFRGSISTPLQVAACLWLSMASATVVAVIAILQVNNLFGVPELLFRYYDNPFEGNTQPVTGRGTSTIASSFGVADVMIMNFLIAITWLRYRRTRRGVLAAGALLFLSGCIVAGAFSGFIGLGVAILAAAIITGRLGRTLAVSIPGAAAASVLFWPVIERRLSGFDRPTGLPHSWEGRWENLERFYFPELFSNLNWLLGVRPSPRVPAPETWRTFVYLESGYIWLLWVGGVALVAAFVFFVWVSARSLWRITRERADAVGIAATTSLAYLVVIGVLMLFDPHLTVRGSADLFFPLLALSFVGGGRRSRSSTEASAKPPERGGYGRSGGGCDHRSQGDDPP